jgi:hypothetical protein
MRYGVVYVAYGVKAEREVAESRKGLSEGTHIFVNDEFDPSSKYTMDQQAHIAKTQAFQWSPFEYTLMLDADTRVMDASRLSLGFEAMKLGWEMLMVPSFPPRKDAVLWHLSRAEKDYTLDKLGRFGHYMFNTGVMFFRKCRRVQNLFTSWEREWSQFKDRDQGAFLRALKDNPVKLFLLGKDFNSKDGTVVKHLFGRASN